jgi:biopolymer transport protein ExbB/TolQ
MNFFAGNALWNLVHQADFISSTVLLILLFASIISWTVVLYKWLELRKKAAELDRVARQLRSVQTLEGLVAVGEASLDTPAGTLLTRILSQLKMSLLQQTDKKRLSLQHLEQLRMEADAAIFDITAAQESYLPVLKVAAEVGPLLGLLGTVWGLIHAFVRISQEQNADIVTVAPGIAEALITTLIGLVVAVPALIFYHVLSRRVQHIEQQLLAIAQRCEKIVQASLQQPEVAPLETPSMRSSQISGM